MIVRAAEAALNAGAAPVIIVLGAYEDRVRDALAGLPVDIVSNPRWADGMGASISVGVARMVAQTPHVDAALIAVCDQPYFQAETVAALHAAFRGHDSIVAAHYAGRVGVPVLFGRDYFDALTTLHGDQGAKQILAENSTRVISVALPELATDLDTQADCESLNIKINSDRGDSAS